MPLRPAVRRTLLRALPLVAAVLIAPACSRPKPVASGDALLDLQDARLPIDRREQAIRDAWAQMLAGQLDRTVVREDLKSLASSGRWPTRLRLVALGLLADDPDPAGAANSRAVVVRMLPREPDRDVTLFLCELAQQRGWTEATPSLVRSLARPWDDVPDAHRPEHRAIAALNPDRPIERVVYEVFLDPPSPQAAAFIPVERVQADAWALLGRLDPAGTMRRAFVEVDAGAASAHGQAAIDAIRAGLAELGVLPTTAHELLWLVSLRQPRWAAWWIESSAAIATLDEQHRRGLALRHAEAVRWSAAHRPEWLGLSRDALLDELRERLAPREIRKRTARDRGEGPGPSERLEDWADRLSWGDLVSILVIDDALALDAARRALFAQAAMDRDDTSAEYGGILLADAARRAAVPVLFPPRPGDRHGDETFVAPADMIEQGVTALAHYHFHAQQRLNGRFAGPSPGDLAYADRMARTCVVFTSIGRTTLNADVYLPGGVVIDLGMLRDPGQ